MLVFGCVCVGIGQGFYPRCKINTPSFTRTGTAMGMYTCLHLVCFGKGALMYFTKFISNPFKPGSVLQEYNCQNLKLPGSQRDRFRVATCNCFRI